MTPKDTRNTIYSWDGSLLLKHVDEIWLLVLIYRNNIFLSNFFVGEYDTNFFLLFLC